MLTTASRAYGVADPAEARLMSGREFLQAILDGQLPAPPIARTLSFWLTEVGDGFAVFEGDTGTASFEPARDRARRLGADPHRQRGRLRRPHAAASRRQLCDDRDQGQFLPTDRRRTRAASAPKGARLAAGGASSPARRGSSTPRAAFLRMGPRR